MQKITRSIALGLLILAFVAVSGMDQAVSEKMKGEFNEMPTMVLTTDNGSTNVELVIENATVDNKKFTIDQPQVVTFNMKFLDPISGQAIEHMNYNFMVTDANGIMVHKIHRGHSHDGMNSYSLLFPDTGSFTLTIGLEGTGGPPPYDPTFTGTANSSIAVTPEFPVTVMVTMAAVVGIGIVATRFKNPLRL